MLKLLVLIGLSNELLSKKWMIWCGIAEMILSEDINLLCDNMSFFKTCDFLRNIESDDFNNLLLLVEIIP